MNIRHRPGSAPMERDSLLGLAFYKHYVPTGRGPARRILPEKQEVHALLLRSAALACTAGCQPAGLAQLQAGSLSYVTRQRSCR